MTWLSGSPSWSPDGKRIVFTSSKSRLGKNRDVYVMDADGGNPRRVSKNPFDEWDPSWSPDGERIAFTSAGVRNVEAGFWRIYVMDTDGKNLRRLSNNDVNDYQPSWSPDGKRIAFTSWRDGAHDIYVMDADGR